MPPPCHSHYLKSLRAALNSKSDGFPKRVEQTFPRAFLMLTELDLEPARHLLTACYSTRRRGTPHRDPIVMLRTLILSILLEQTSINKWVRQLRGCPILRAMCGLEPEDMGPGVGTIYDFLHRLHNGPKKQGVESPSDVLRRASRAQQPCPKLRKSKGKKGGKKSKNRPNEQEDKARTALQIVEEVQKNPDLRNPLDLTSRLQQILLEVAIKPSKERGFLGDTSALVVGGDGSTLPTGAQGRGKRLCNHDKFTRCECPRVYSDPDARSGWDSHRKCYFFGHRFYELSTTINGHDLPLSLSIAPGNCSDMTEGVRTIDRFQRTLRDHTDGWKMTVATLDRGHDALPIYQYLRKLSILPIIPIRSAPAVLPDRPDIRLSKNAIPLCKAGCEMGAWGTAGKDRMNFICPLKTGLSQCPLAPPEDLSWRCRPDLKHGPTTIMRADKHPRYFPGIHRTSKRFHDYRKQRSGTERSNSLKKVKYKLVQSRHRRSSFWLIRLNLIAIAQHVQVWVGNEDVKKRVQEFLTSP